MRGQLVMHQCLHHVIYIHDVNIDASQADRALNWTARINKIVEQSNTRIDTHFLNQKYTIN